MYVPFQHATFVPITFNPGSYIQEDINFPRVDAVVGRGTDGRLWLETTNVDPDHAVEVGLNLTGATAHSASGETLTAPKVDSVNTFDAPQTVVPRPISTRTQNGKITLKLEPKSVAVVSLEQ